MVKACRKVEKDQQKTVSAKGADLRVHFKNTYETATAVKGKTLDDARQYLEDVLEHKRCIPYKRFTGGIGRTAQAKEFKLTQGRWPTKSVKVVLDLIENARANAEAKELDVEDLYIWHICCQRAMKGRRRTYRAHGRINPYMSNPCHIELICKSHEENVAKPEADGVHKTIRLTKKQSNSRKLRVGA